MLRTIVTGLALLLLIPTASSQTGGADVLRDLGSAFIMPHSGTQSVMLFDGETGDLIDDEFIVFTQHSGVPIQAILNFDRGGIFVSVQAGTTGNVVYEYALDGTFLGVFAPQGGQDLDILQNIRGIRIDPTGQKLWVTVGGGANGGGIAEFDRNGNYLGNFVEPAGSPMGRPWSILPRDSDVLVTDEVDDGVHRFDYDGTYLGLWNQSSLNNPHQIAEAENGNVLVAGFSVPSGAFEFLANGTLHAHYTARPSLRGIAELPNGNLLVSSPTGVFEITRANELVRTIVTGQARHITRINPVSLSFSPSTLQGEVIEGKMADVTFTMHNNTTGSLGFVFTDLPEFISQVNPSAGSIPGEGSIEITATLDGTAVSGGVHHGMLTVETDEPANNVFEYPAVVNVIGAHGCEIEPNPIAFGEVIIGFDVTLEATVTNGGTGPCAIVAASVDHEDFEVSMDLPVTLQPGDSAPVATTYAPSSPGEIAVALTLSVENGEDVSATITATGMAPPVATVSPSSIELVVTDGEPVDSAVLTLSNVAVETAADLEYTISLVAKQGTAREVTDTARMRNDAGPAPVERRRSVMGDGPFPQTEFARTDEEELILDGGFEAGTPNPFWEEFSSNFGTPLCDIPGCAPFNPDFNPHTGDWWLWLGGHNTEVEVGYVAQEVVIPAGPATLSFYLQIPTANGTGYMRVLIEETMIFEVTEADASSYSEYTPVAIDASAFADETAHTVRFESTTFPPGVTNFFVDDVSLISTGPGLLSVDPMSGLVEAGESGELVVTASYNEGVEHGSYPYELRIHTNDPEMPLLVVDVTVHLTPVGTGSTSQAGAFSLEQNYPNPFTGETAIAFSLPDPASVRIEVFDVTGRNVATLIDAELPAGSHATTWDATGLAAGVYFFRIQAGGFTATRRAIVLR